MKLATWNVNGMKARLEFMKLWLEDRAPDVVGLQELKLTDESFPHEFFAELGYQALTHGQKSWNGVAVLSRLPMETGAGRPCRARRPSGARLITVAVDDGSAGRPAVHHGLLPQRQDAGTRRLPSQARLVRQPGRAPGRQPDWCQRALRRLQHRPASPSDSWMGAEGEGRLFPHGRRAYSPGAGCRDLGLTDLYRALHPDEQTFLLVGLSRGRLPPQAGPAHRSPARHRARIAERLTAAGTDRDYRKKQEGLTASDHAPVIAELARPG